MDDLRPASIPLFKRIDQAVFEQINQFKKTPGYTGLQDFYNGLEEEQQKLFKAAIIFLIFLFPSALIGFMWWNNTKIHNDLSTRIALVAKANEIIGQNRSLRSVTPAILSQNPIDGESMMTSRLSNLLSTIGIDLSKVKISNFTGDMISSTIMKAEADFAFNNLSTDELMNIFTTLIQREKFRIQSLEVSRNDQTNLLNGKFHAVHFSTALAAGEEE